MNLTIIENTFVPVYKGRSGNTYVNARELHEKLEVGRDFSTWIKGKLKKYGFIEDKDYHKEEIFDGSETRRNSVHPNGGAQNTRMQDKIEYWLFLDTAKEIAMVENNEKGREIRRYFIEVEKKYREFQNEQQCMTAGQLLAISNSRIAEGKNKVAQLNALNKILVSSGKMSDEKMDKCIEYAKLLETKTEQGSKQVEEMLALSKEIQYKTN